MLFNSLEFFVFFPIVTIVYGIIPAKWRKLWLFFASYFFYMCWNPYYIVLIVFSTIVTYIGGLLIEKAKDNSKNNSQSVEKSNTAKIILIITCCINLALLVFFKYTPWFVEIVSSIIGRTVTMPIFFALPVGISFYTFQALGYTADVYNGKIKAEKNFATYALFVSFFPQLVAGPIERTGNLLTQIQKLESIKFWNYKRITSGLVIMLWGFFLKLVIADRVAMFVDPVFEDYAVFGTTELLLAGIGFALQVYCDFASYSVIAMGAAKVLGIGLMENFNTPFFAQSVTEFWTRWHMSLCGWFRDYVYIPLGGSRCGKLKHYRNLMVVFILSGFWHGANWTYVVWGGLNGLLQIIEKELKPLGDRLVDKFSINVKAFSHRFWKTLITDFLFVITVIIFRAENIKEAFIYLGRMFTSFNPWVLFDGSIYNVGLDRTEMNILIVACVVLFFVSYVKYTKGMLIDTALESQGILFRWCAIIALFIFVVIYGVYGPGFNSAAFIYFQF